MAHEDNINQLPISNVSRNCKIMACLWVFDHEFSLLNFFDLDFGPLVKKVGHPCVAVCKQRLSVTCDFASSHVMSLDLCILKLQSLPSPLLDKSYLKKRERRVSSNAAAQLHH